jgi:hypothetical protein
MSTTPVPPKESGSNPNKVMVRNIITGVITTVLAATIIYFMGFNNRSGSKADNPLGKDKPYEQVNPKIVTGNWNTEGAEIFLFENGNIQWNVLSNGDVASGTWRIINNQLYMYVTTRQTGEYTTWIFNLTDLKPDSFNMTLSTPPYNAYHLVRRPG